MPLSLPLPNIAVVYQNQYHTITISIIVIQIFVLFIPRTLLLLLLFVEDTMIMLLVYKNLPLGSYVLLVIIYDSYYRFLFIYTETLTTVRSNPKSKPSGLNLEKNPISKRSPPLKFAKVISKRNPRTSIFLWYYVTSKALFTRYKLTRVRPGFVHTDKNQKHL